MAPKLLGSMFLAEGNSAEPVQIISKPGVQQEVPILQQIQPHAKSTLPQRRYHIVWRNVVIFVYLHIAAFYGLYYSFTIAQGKTVFWAILIAELGALGVTCGAHRLWTHRAYKAKLPLRIYLAFWQTVALQNHIYEWARDHRVHHKFTDSDADPHNASRGFFFSHIGWLLVKKHKDVFVRGKTVDMSDLEADPVVRFQRKYYMVLAPLLCLLFPSFIPWYFWGENPIVSWNVAGVMRYVISLHGTWLVNSAAHIWGTKPYDKNIQATENRGVCLIAIGEGFHNYHHIFPWDYKAAELGNYRLNMSTAFIDLMAKIGWAYDLKTVSTDMISRRAKRTGDGTKQFLEPKVKVEYEEHNDEDLVWGWDDKDMKQTDRSMAEIHHRQGPKAA